MSELIVSIAIPTYNRAFLLKKTIDAVIDQIEKDNLHNEVELVISDNCSTDDTKELVKGYIDKNKYKIVYQRNEKNVGVIKNILELVPISNAKFWMFYGDDDIVPDGNLIKLVNCFKENSSYAAFMFKQQGADGKEFWNIDEPKALTISEAAAKYFYYIGNAGVSAVNMQLAKQIVLENRSSLINTCWPQTEILFLATHLSATKKIYANSLESAYSPPSGLIVNNSYYMFETMLYALIRCAISIEKKVKGNFAEVAIPSIYGVIYFEKSFKRAVIENYLFYDFKNERRDFVSSLESAMKTIDKKHQKYISVINDLIAMPEFLLKCKMYLAFISESKKADAIKKLPLFNKLKVLSPFGYRAMIRWHRNNKMMIYSKKNKNIISANGDYF